MRFVSLTLSFYTLFSCMVEFILTLLFALQYGLRIIELVSLRDYCIAEFVPKPKTQISSELFVLSPQQFIPTRCIFVKIEEVVGWLKFTNLLNRPLSYWNL